MYKASLIISIYNNIDFLKLVLDSLKNQTEQNFEIIISEDAQHETVKKFIAKYPFQNDYQHLTHEDIGWRKNKALNNAIRNSKSNYLIFIDGDCILHPLFIENHLKYANDHYVLAGKRVKLNQELSDILINNKNGVHLMQRTLLRNLLFGKKNGTRFIEEGIYISPNGPFGFITKLRKLNHLKGCNMSFTKKAIYDINGFDEDYTLPAIGEDTDLSWRFEAAGYKHKSLRNLAVQYHLFHKESWTDQSLNEQIMTDKQSRNEFICKNGLKKL